MTTTNDEAPPADTSEAAVDLLAEHGITRVPVDYFHVGGYRYTNLDDAVAQAKRQHSPR